MSGTAPRTSSGRFCQCRSRNARGVRPPSSDAVSFDIRAGRDLQRALEPGIPAGATTPATYRTTRQMAGTADRTVVSIEEPRANGASELLRENARFHAGPWLEPGRSHQRRPLGTVRACRVAMSQVDGNMCGLVANHLAQQFFGLVEQSRMESDPSAGRMAAAEGGSETSARFEVGTFGEVRKRPGSSPFGQPRGDPCVIHGRRG